MSVRRSILAAALAAIGLAAATPAPEPGSPAPAFRAQDQDGIWRSLSDYRGKQAVVLYFYPKDDTPGCTKEACSLRDGMGALLGAGAAVLGVSADDVTSHKAFAEKYHLPFPLLADPGRTLIDAYGVRMPVVGLARRITFIIDKEGIVRDVLKDVDTAGHDRQVLDRLAAINRRP